MSMNGSRPVLVALALLISSFPLAANATYVPNTKHDVQFEARVHETKVSSQRNAHIPVHDQNPVADLILG
jgi:hypothetical protein